MPSIRQNAHSDVLPDFRNLGVIARLLVAVNAAEWHAHRGVLHRRVKLLEVFYLRHTPLHHALFVPGDMVLRSPAELRLVLLPALALPLVLVVNVPITLALAALGQRNLGLLWLAVVAFAFAAHELLHVAYHLSPERWPGRSRLITFLRHHHEHHHVPHLMAHWNFNATVPLWDLLRGTWWRPRSARAADTRRPA